MKGTPTLLSLAVGLALASPSLYAAGFSCPADSALTPIPAIQGSGDKSPLVPDDQFESAQSVSVKAVVSGLGESLNKGFYLQDVQGDGNPETSDGIFVYLNDKNFASKYPDIQPGALVCLEAKVEEYYGHTQLKPLFDGSTPRLTTLAQGAAPAATALRVLEGETLARALERHEGMRVRLDADSALKISRNFSYDYAARRNNLVLAHGAPLMKPTQLHVASSPEAVALAEANASNRVFLESDFKAGDGKLPWLPAWEPEQGYLRIGDAPINLEAMVGYSYNEYRLIVPRDQTITAGDLLRTGDNDRQSAPARLDGTDLRIGSFNVLNYFTSHSSVGGALNVLCADQADADSAKGCNRGAKSLEEFQLQRAKIVNAITEMDADLLGLMEMENNGFDEHAALHDLVESLNARQKEASKHYAFVTLPKALLTEDRFFGGDAIMVAMIYRPALLTPSGDADVIPLPQQRYTTGGVTKSAGQRDSLVQRFTVAGSDAPLTLVVNHLKSKGSGCYENGDGKTEPADLQGKCTEFRVSAAKVLGEAVSKMPGQVLLVGDFNSYAKEDPIRVLTDYAPVAGERQIRSASHTYIGDKPYEQMGQTVAKGYGLVDLNVKFNQEKAISYSYEAELGTLDYALANPALADKVVAVADWHINSFESNLFEYGSAYTGDLIKSDNPFSASDHDPVIVDLKLKEASKGGGGAMGALLLALLPLAWRRRR
ncbi:MULTISPECIES: ExeM/NucH family extracellular endonuclease [Aeromonas]|uniref:ExeM/NucH family extracellular endonuclease n=1 Tax=Aeromonas TaxID=642 RepID=UPI000DF7FF99|nr:MULTISPECIES: ExeM/NucH family extracellular endonuclease [Aeromonas]MCV3281686.1 ExeM/NucH family extracellular endonuclease [Aeromonas caviae]MDX7844443.1 ExeM/NucH family extracellular endonuclease [Aeromonas caviae]RDD48801.1 GlyGly-CTERM sorting domain-containing protein [Aeromonas sp. ARM81]BBT20368.1 nuclease [Aeromonas caviae]